MKGKEPKEEFLSIPFIEKIRDEANKTIEEEVKDFRWDRKRWEVSQGQVSHIIEAYKRLSKYEEPSSVFVKHIENHLRELKINGKVMCKICGKTIDEIYEKEAK